MESVRARRSVQERVQFWGWTATATFPWWVLLVGKGYSSTPSAITSWSGCGSAGLSQIFPRPGGWLNEPFSAPCADGTNAVWWAINPGIWLATVIIAVSLGHLFALTIGRDLSGWLADRSVRGRTTTDRADPPGVR